MTDRPTRTLGVTHPEWDDGPRRARSRKITYAVGSIVLTLLVASAVFDQLTEVDIWGVSGDRVRAAEDGYVLEVKYPSVTRPAIASPFEIFVTKEGGFGGPVDIAIDPEFLEMWDYQAFYPEPSGWRADPDMVVMTVEPTDLNVLRVFFDARIQPAQQSGVDAWVAVLDGAGDVIVRVDFSTRVLP